MSENDAQRFTTPEFTANYVWLDEKRKASDKLKKNDGTPADPYWCTTFKADKDDPVWEDLEALVELAMRNKLGIDEGDDLPKKWRSPIKDGDDWEDEDFHGCYVLEMKNLKRKPITLVYNPKGKNKPPTDYGEEIYPGMLCVATARFSGYDNASKGVSCYLSNVLKLANGERIGPVEPSAEEDFDDYVPNGGKPAAAKKTGGRRKKATNPLA